MLIRIILLIAIFFSVGVCFIKPKMHTPILIYSSDFEIAELQTVVEKTVSQPVETSKIKEVKKTVAPIKSTTQNAQKVYKHDLPQKIENTESIKSVKFKKEVKTDKKPVIVKQTQAVSKVEEKNILTEQEQEEIIAWNKWHSNLQNSIMRDVNMPQVPYGTKFNFTFNVDKYGRISDIKTWSDNPEYNIYAIQYIAPVIRSYQGKGILSFPQNSQRLTAKFEGRFKTSNTGQNKYSKASDFNDTEKIRK